jgi:hypothetical protein
MMSAKAVAAEHGRDEALHTAKKQKEKPTDVTANGLLGLRVFLEPPLLLASRATTILRCLPHQLNSLICWTVHRPRYWICLHLVRWIRSQQ